MVTIHTPFEWVIAPNKSTDSWWCVEQESSVFLETPEQEPEFLVNLCDQPIATGDEQLATVAGAVSPRPLNITNHCSLTTMSTTPTITTTPEDPNSSDSLFSDPLLRYIIIGSAGGIGLLLCVIIIICIVACYMLLKTKRSRAAEQNTNLNASSFTPTMELAGMLRTSACVQWNHNTRSNVAVEFIAFQMSISRTTQLMKAQENGRGQPNQERADFGFQEDCQYPLTEWITVLINFFMLVLSIETFSSLFS